MLNTDDLRLESLRELDAAWRVRGHGRRLRAVSEGALALRARFDAMGPVVFARSLPITTLLYPTKYAFQAAALSPAPFVTLTHRAILLQFQGHGGLKTLLFNPTDVERAKATPYFARLIERFGETTTRWITKQYDALEVQLAGLGLGVDDIDYVAFDHFHTQDLRGLLGTADGRLPPRFPNATLLTPRAEWEEWDDLHPMQRAWYVADGKAGVRDEHLALTDSDLALGDGVMLLRTPGHTVGNQTLFFKTDRGVWGCSENGTSADNWSPLASRVPGVAAAARQGSLDLIINANTPEGAADQYTAMTLEKLLVDRVPGSTDFVQMFPSSEVTPGALAPGLSPTYVHGHVEHGAVGRRA